MEDKKSCGFVYKFLNGHNEVVYIGSTGNIKRRIMEHLNSAKMQGVLERTSKIAYCEVPTRNDALIAETILIQKYMPSANKATVADGSVSLASFDEESVAWSVKSPDDFIRTPRDPYKRTEEQPDLNTATVFRALRELFPDADLRRDRISEKQKYVLYCAMMSDGDYWLPRMTDYEVELATEQLFVELARKGCFVGGLDAWANRNCGKDGYRYDQ